MPTMDAVDKCRPFLVGIRGVRQFPLYDRLQATVASMSGRFTNLGKLLYIEAVQGDASAHHFGGILKARHGNRRSSGKGNKMERYENGDAAVNKATANEDF
ncbi:hypothetical protein V6N13_128040 [Hibiscus sabdariffa]